MVMRELLLNSFSTLQRNIGWGTAHHSRTRYILILILIRERRPRTRLRLVRTIRQLCKNSKSSSIHFDCASSTLTAPGRLLVGHAHAVDAGVSDYTATAVAVARSPSALFIGEPLSDPSYFPGPSDPPTGWFDPPPPFPFPLPFLFMSFASCVCSCSDSSFLSFTHCGRYSTSITSPTPSIFRVRKASRKWHHRCR